MEEAFKSACETLQPDIKSVKVDLTFGTNEGESSQKDGFEQGKEIGRRQGQAQGNRLGWEKGAAIGSEVGFYAGFAKSLLEEMSKESETRPRVLKTLEKIVKIAEDFPLSDPQHPELQDKLTELRTKFKQVLNPSHLATQKTQVYLFELCTLTKWACTIRCLDTLQDNVDFCGCPKS